MSHDDDHQRDRDRHDAPQAPGNRAAQPAGDDLAALAALSAFVDGELPAAELAAVREQIAADPAAARRVADYGAQKAALQALCAGLDEDTPAAPAAFVLRERTPWWWRAGMAAAWIVVGAGLTLAATTFWPRWGAAGSAQQMSADLGGLARRADVAYAVYSPEQRHPVEVSAADETHLVTWLSRRLDQRITIPSLHEYGYELVGGRLLPGDAGPAAQFMYENNAGERLTLYMSAAPHAAARSGAHSAALRLLRDGDRSTIYWRLDQMGYALSGPQTEGRLREIAFDVCSDLGGKPDEW